jgi:hypothetical protein
MHILRGNSGLPGQLGRVIPNGESHISSDLFKEFSILIDAMRNEGVVKIIGCEGLDNWLEEDLNAQFVAAYTKKFSLPPHVAMLSAHGNSNNGQWTYYDGKRVCRVQNWIDRHAKRASLLIIHSCNPERETITSPSSLVLAPSSIIRGARLSLDEEGPWYLFVPRVGWLDPYTIEYELKQLTAS